MPGEFDSDRRDYIWQKRLNENKGLMIEHLQEMAQIMTQLADESRRCIPMGERRFKQISHALREVDIQLKNLYLIENEAGRMEVSLTMKNLKKNSLSSEEVGDLLSVLLNMHLVSAQDNAFFVGEGWQTYFYVEEARFHVLTGVAKAVKETEKISGDNYALFETETGNLTAVLSDGMGSGEEACRESTMVVEMLEELLEAGFPAKMAIEIMNTALVIGREDVRFSTIDVCLFDLYTGKCEFVKAGASTTFIKRSDSVERITSATLPIGVIKDMEIESVEKELSSGDFVIMVTDGVMDALPAKEQDTLMIEFIREANTVNPKELAHCLLGKVLEWSGEKPTDDMTIMAVGLWKL